MKRRTFLLGLAALSGGGFALAWSARVPDLTGDRTLFALVPGETALNGWVRVAADGMITVAVPRAEVGQGIATLLATMVAEELDVNLEHVRVEHPRQSSLYANSTMLVDGMAMLPGAGEGHWAEVVRQLASNGMRQLGLVGTGGSSSARDAWLPMRSAGAAARQLLVQAAAQHWQVAVAECTARAGVVSHAASGRSAGYGELAPAAARLSLDSTPVLRTPDQWRLLGRDQPRLDVPGKVNGRAQFGIDSQVPKGLFAAVCMAPVHGAELVRVSPESVTSRPGVVAVVTLPGGVAVVADQWWRAQQAIQHLDVEFSRPAERADSGRLRTRYQQLAADGHAQVHEQRGDQTAAREASGHQVLARDYWLPFLAHAALEPVNCTARISGGVCEVWVGSQMPTLLRWFAAKASGLPSDKVVFHAAPLGGSFGRRLEIDMVVQAVTIAARLPGQAVKLVWSRQEDMRNDFYRPMALVRQRVSLDDKGQPLSWHTRVVTPSIMKSVMERLLPMAANDLMPDKTAVDGQLDLPYAIPALRIEHVPAPAGLPVGFWRSVGHSINAFAVESMLDEMALAAGQDGLQYRLQLLQAHPRQAALLQAAAKAGGWSNPTPAGHGRGIALAGCFGSWIAVMVEVASPDHQGIRVQRITAAVDCGRALQPDNVRAQIEGGLLFGLAAALQGRITVRDGQVEQSNFNDFPALRMQDTPPVEVILIDTPGAALGGIGEVGVPALAPALASAVFAATGRRARELPLGPLA